MKISDFNKLKAIDDGEPFHGLKTGDRFLYGRSMVEQLKNVGERETVTYYEVTGITSRGTVLYEPIIETLEK